MSAKFQSIGTFTVDRDGMRAVIYGNIIEGTIRSGMRLALPFNGAVTMTVTIESIDYLDKIAEKVAYVALVLSPEDNKNGVAGMIQSMKFENEILDVMEEAVTP